MLRLSIKELFNQFQQVRVSPTEIFKESIEQAQSYKNLNSFITITEDVGLSQSKEAEIRYQKKSPLSVLDGLPIAIKDNFCSKNVPTTCGSKMLQNFIPKYDATVLNRLVNAGACLVGKTNLDEFAMGSGTVDSIYGPTKNIWAFQTEDCIAGGSSGGSATAVASYSCFSAIGSDTGGSTRNPAAYSGLVGLKPTYGLVSRHGLIPLVNSMDVPGILSRTVDDVVQILNAVAGFDPNDSTTARKEFNSIKLEKEPSVRGLKVGIPVDYYCPDLSPEVKQVWSNVADVLENNGASVKQVSMPHTKYSIVCYSILNQCEVASNMARYDGLQFGYRADNNISTEHLYAETRAKGFNLVVRSRILAGNYFLLSRNYEKYIKKAMQIRRLISDDFKKVWEKEKIDVLLTPTTLTDAPTYKSFSNIDNREQCATQDFCTQPANMCGCPAVSIPITLSERKLPLSIQLMSPNFNEETLLNCANFIERSFNFNNFHNQIKIGT